MDSGGDIGTYDSFITTLGASIYFSDIVKPK